MEKYGLELKLVAVGILLAVYWQSLPQILTPTIINGKEITFALLKLILFGAGLGWFVTLLIGVFSLAFPKIKSLEKLFELFFKVANIEITAILVSAAIYYLIYIL